MQKFEHFFKKLPTYVIYERSLLEKNRLYCSSQRREKKKFTQEAPCRVGILYVPLGRRVDNALIRGGIFLLYSLGTDRTDAGRSQV